MSVRRRAPPSRARGKPHAFLNLAVSSLACRASSPWSRAGRAGLARHVHDVCIALETLGRRDTVATSARHSASSVRAQQAPGSRLSQTSCRLVTGHCGRVRFCPAAVTATRLVCLLLWLLLAASLVPLSGCPSCVLVWGPGRGLVLRPRGSRCALALALVAAQVTPAGRTHSGGGTDGAVAVVDELHGFCVRVCVQVCACACVCKCARACASVHVCVRVRVQVCVHACSGRRAPPPWALREDAVLCVCRGLVFCRAGNWQLLCHHRAPCCPHAGVACARPGSRASRAPGV